MRLLTCQPKNKQYHNLTTTIQAPKNLENLLGLGVKFCPQPRISLKTKDLTECLDRFRRNLHCKVFFAGNESDYDPNQLRISSGWEPERHKIPPEIWARTSHFSRTVRQLFIPRTGTTNLTNYQAHLLKTIRNNKVGIAVPADKNLGFVYIERAVYTNKIFEEHLSDATTYQQLGEQQAKELMDTIKNTIKDFGTYWNQKLSLSEDDNKYLQMSVEEAKDPFNYLYGTIKVHKEPWTIRPVVSTCGSTTYGIGKLTDQWLQPIVKKMPYVIHSSQNFINKMHTALKELPDLDWNNIRAFTADAKSMYTYIDTTHALEVLGEFFRTDPICQNIEAEQTIQALEIIMKSNIFKFDDTFWLQLTGTAMGTPPACAYANIYQGIHENVFIPEFKDQLAFFGRLIDDCFGLWICDPDPATDEAIWLQFQERIKFGKLEWKFSERLRSINFLDVQVTITDAGISTNIYEKPHNLYQYLPPHSCHAPGVGKSLIYGQVYRAYTLISDPSDRFNFIRTFYDRMRRRGWSSNYLLPVFKEAVIKQQKRQTETKDHERMRKANFDYLYEKIARQDGTWECRRELERAYPELLYMDHDTTKNYQQLFFHIKYHPNNPSQRTIHITYHNTIQKPKQKPTDPNCTLYENSLEELTNFNLQSLQFYKLTVAYHKQKNLKEILFQRKFKAEEGKQASLLGYTNPIDPQRSLPELPTFQATPEENDLGSTAGDSNNE